MADDDALWKAVGLRRRHAVAAVPLRHAQLAATLLELLGTHRPVETDDRLYPLPYNAAHWAALRGDLETLQELHRTRPEAFREAARKEVTVVECAARGGDLDVLQFCLTQGGEPQTWSNCAANAA